MVPQLYHPAPEPAVAVAGRLDLLEGRLGTIEEMVRRMMERGEPATTPAQSAYTTDELARALGKTSFTVREWARLGRIVATKRSSRRGGKAEWRISADEVARYRDEGLLPVDMNRNAG